MSTYVYLLWEQISNSNSDKDRDSCRVINQFIISLVNPLEPLTPTKVIQDHCTLNRKIQDLSQVSIVKIKVILIMILGHDNNPASKDTGSFAPPQVSIKYNIP